jgi:hypothetical protein
LNAVILGAARSPRCERQLARHLDLARAECGTAWQFTGLTHERWGWAMLAGGAMPAAHYVHPEFGLLCPTPRLRRRLRIVFVCMILAWIGGAVLRAVNAPPTANPSSANSLSTMTAAGGDESAGKSPDAGQAPAAGLAMRPSPPAVAETGVVEGACEQGNSLHRTWAYLEGKCVAGKARKPRAIRVDRPPLAAIAIGRIAAPERVPEPAAFAPSVPTGSRANPPKSAAAAPAEMAASTEPSSRPAAASKKPQKTARSQQRRREPGGTEAVGWREVRTDDWAARGYGERDYGRGGFAREGAFGMGYGQRDYGERDYGRGGYAREGAFGFFR